MRKSLFRVAKFLNLWRRSSAQKENPQPPRFVSRVSETKVLAAITRVLGRKLLGSERCAFYCGWRPQGLLSADDAYSFRVGSPHYLGCAAVVYVDSLAIDGYARFDDKPLALVERAFVTTENAGVETPVVEIID